MAVSATKPLSVWKVRRFSAGNRECIRFQKCGAIPLTDNI
ncbi:hypothetical protein BRO54_1131 [Geobacillus proteiniphilus]|uniref:Uncharacterized protein n=1 Tax=Geobacillus proteiniphilus TaxID=860353 RepID=A0A1Q5T4G9_9BACL|nr:hypothetical protein BRO54_1131 [Geobacillus proteiniphilus]